MASRKPLKIALLWSQFSAYHVDRCEAVATRLAGWAEVLAVEVASKSALYAWEPSGDVAGALKVTLFPGRSYESIPWPRRLVAQFRAMRRCDWVFVGIGYNEPDVILLGWLLRLWGVNVVLMSESKFDDFPRSLAQEVTKAALLAPYHAAIVGGRRHIGYMRFLGFRRRTVLPGYDVVSVERIRSESAAHHALGQRDHEARPFIFVGRFIDKKNIDGLVNGYAAYASRAGAAARKLILIGSGPEEANLRRQIEALGICGLVEFPGFLPAHEVSKLVGRALCLVLVSSVEQWELVVNEALACGLPVIASSAVGARDALVRNLVNGFVIEAGSVEGIAQAMTALATDADLWQRMSKASEDKSWLGDAARLADAVQLLIDPSAQPAGDRLAQFVAELEPQPQRGQV